MQRGSKIPRERLVELCDFLIFVEVTNIHAAVQVFGASFFKGLGTTFSCAVNFKPHNLTSLKQLLVHPDAQVMNVTIVFTGGTLEIEDMTSFTLAVSDIQPYSGLIEFLKASLPYELKVYIE
jgi:hypothetical protein